MDAIVTFLKFIVLVVVLVLWTPIGFVFWIPLIVRATALFGVGILSAAFRGAQADAAGARLEEAVAFYPRGFGIAVKAVMGEHSHADDGWDIDFDNVVRITLELVWAGFVWLSILGAILRLMGVEVWNLLVTCLH